MLSLAGQDIVFSSGISYTDPGYSTASIWQMNIGPINPGTIIFCCLLWQLLKLKKVMVPSFVKRAIVWFATVPFITALFYGGFFTENAGIEVIVDLRFGLMLVLSIILLASFLKKKSKNLNKILALFIGVLLARHLIDLIYVISNIGPAIIPGVTRGSVDSAKGGVIFLIFFGIGLIWAQRRIFIGMSIVIPSVLLLVAYGTRNLWITFTIGSLLVIIYLGLRRSISFLMICAFLLVIGIWSLFIINPESAEVIYARSKTITEGRPLDKYIVMVEYNMISRIDPVRYAQIFNVLDSVKNRYAWFWGTGYGGYYDDTVIPFPLYIENTFPDYSLETGKFYKTHQFTTHIFLKHGLIGFLVILSLWLIPGYALYNIFRTRDMFTKDQPRILNTMMLCIVAFLPTAIFQTYWSSKGLLINGIIIASCIEYLRHHSFIKTV